MMTLLNLNLVDYLIILVLLLSTLVSILRGFVKELISLLTWIIGFWVAYKFSDQGANFLKEYISNPSLRMIISFSTIFIVIVIFGAIINFLISMILVKTGLSGTDRALGVLFGFARGVLLIGMILLLISTTAFIEEGWWKKSVLIPHLQVVVNWLHGILPQKFTSMSNILANSTK
ncbi:MAG: CvpA family protein [Gammaproteobacteria bacterium]|nr:CvpA family protein [Gammaproteobacteria bacterium]